MSNFRIVAIILFAFSLVATASTIQSAGRPLANGWLIPSVLSWHMIAVFAAALVWQGLTLISEHALISGQVRNMFVGFTSVVMTLLDWWINFVGVSGLVSFILQTNASVEFARVSQWSTMEWIGFALQAIFAAILSFGPSAFWGNDSHGGMSMQAEEEVQHA